MKFSCRYNELGTGEEMLGNNKRKWFIVFLVLFYIFVIFNDYLF